MKKLLFILLLSVITSMSWAQTDTSIQQDQRQADTIVRLKPAAVPKRIKKRVSIDSLKRKRFLDSLLVASNALKKDTNSLVVHDTTQRVTADTIKKAVSAVVIKKPIDSIYRKLLDNPFLRSKSKPIFLVINERKRTSKDEMFYLLAGLLLLLDFIKLVFSKYFLNIFRLFFQPSFRQKQTREQLQQGNLPSLLLNLFFVLSTS
ncbi:MAG: hypothetical protein M3040_09835, partial [Bacteroidota bacterium]|nr:hypothetical protein [Bacteroidota bacterium]